MIERFSDILTGGPTLEQLQARHADAHAALDTAQASYEAAALVAEDGDTAAAKQRDRAARDLEKARGRLSELSAAISAARTRDAAQEAEQARSELAAKWEATEKAMAEREQAAQEVQNLINALGDAWHRLGEVSQAVRRLSPIQAISIDETHRSHVLTTLLRVNLAAVGPTHLGLWPGDPDRMPILADRVRDGNKLVLQARDRPPMPQPAADEETESEDAA